MSQTFEAGEFLVFQLESGFAILRVLATDRVNGDLIWHLAAYDEFFLDVETAEEFLRNNRPMPSIPHIALTNRAFESTQVASLVRIPLGANDLEVLEEWRADQDQAISDRSVRLMLGLR